MFRGPSWVNHSRVPLRSPDLTRRSGNRVALEKTDSSGASSRLAPERTRKFPPLPAGGDRFFCPFLLGEFPLLQRLGRPPRSLEDHAPVIRVAEAKFLVTSLWITGISGTTIGTFPRGLFGCPNRRPPLPPSSA